MIVVLVHVALRQAGKSAGTAASRESATTNVS